MNSNITEFFLNVKSISIEAGFLQEKINEMETELVKLRKEKREVVIELRKEKREMVIEVIKEMNKEFTDRYNKCSGATDAIYEAAQLVGETYGIYHLDIIRAL